MFDALGVLVGLYAAWGAYTGEVYAKSRAWGRTIRREDEPRYFWAVIGIYALLALALVLVF